MLVVAALDPQPLGADDVQYTSTLNLAHTPNGLRLVQVEAHHEADSVERVGARIVRFDAERVGRRSPRPVPRGHHHDRPRPARSTMPPVRFVCRADVSAFEGTESGQPLSVAGTTLRRTAAWYSAAAVEMDHDGALIRAQIEALNVEFWYRVDHQNGEGVAELFCEDGVYSVPGGRNVGRAAIAAVVRGPGGARPAASRATSTATSA